MRFGIHALRVEAKVFCQCVQEGALGIFHRLEAVTFLIGIGSKSAKCFLLFGRPGYVGEVHVESFSRIRDVVILVRLRVDVQGERKFSVTFETRTLFVAF